MTELAPDIDSVNLKNSSSLNVSETSTMNASGPPSSSGSPSPSPSPRIRSDASFANSSSQESGLPLLKGKKPWARGKQAYEKFFGGNTAPSMSPSEPDRKRSQLYETFFGVTELPSLTLPEPERKKPRWSPSAMPWWLKALISLSIVVFVTLMIYFFGGTALEIVGGSLEPPHPIVKLPYASYQGTTLPNGVNQFLGMRYAAPPLNHLRFRAAQDPLVDNTTVLSARTHGATCLSTQTTINAGGSEDCLFVDVFAPPAKPLALLPVYIFIQGGGFNANSNPNYDGSGLVVAGNMGIIVVTFNYRVGLYGFLTSKEVQADGDLNIGLLDQRKVFQWVQRHILLFGGDPNHVTIGGDSAGAASVDLHLTAYDGRDDKLFHATAAESQSFGVQFNITGSQYQYDALAARTGCNKAPKSLECLRNLTTAALQSHNNNMPTPGGGGRPPLFMYSNVVDGNFTTDYTYNLYAQGKFIKIPAIWGADTNDGTIFTPRSTGSIQSMNTFLKNQFPFLTTQHLAQINNYYPMAEQYVGAGQYWRAVSNAYGDMRYMCPGLYLSSVYSNATIPVWTYHYNVIDPPSNATGYGVLHTAETTAIWGPSFVSGGAPKSYFQLNAPIVPIMQGYWTSFIRSKNPNTYRAEGAPLWENWVASKQNRLRINLANTSMETVDETQQKHCAYLTSIGSVLQQ